MSQVMKFEKGYPQKRKMIVFLPLDFWRACSLAKTLFPNETPPQLLYLPSWANEDEASCELVRWIKYLEVRSRILLGY